MNKEDASVRVEHEPAKLEELGIFTWPIWEKEVSEFPWHYDEKEICYLLEGDVTVSRTAERRCGSAKVIW
jgi:uncharacterized protein